MKQWEVPQKGHKKMDIVLVGYRTELVKKSTVILFDKSTGKYWNEAAK